MKVLDSETTKMENEIIINSRCVELLREHKSTWKLDESEFALCDRIGREIADLLPSGVRINPIHCSSADKILQWITAGQYMKRQTSSSLLDERTLVHLTKKQKKEKIKASEIFWPAFFASLTLFWIFIVILLLKAL